MRWALSCATRARPAGVRPLSRRSRLCGLLGYPREELMHMDLRSLTHPDDVAADLELTGKLLRGEIPNFQLEKRYRRRDGNYVWTNLSAALVRTADGEPDYLIAVIEDISQRKLAEQRAVEAALQAFLGAWSQALWSLKSPRELRWHLDVDPAGATFSVIRVAPPRMVA